MYFPLAESTGGANGYEVQKENSGGILGTPKLYEKGGSFNFKVSYISKAGVESELSEPFFVTVKPKPLANPDVAAIAKPLKDDVKKKIEEKQKAAAAKKHAAAAAAKSGKP